MEPPCIVHCVVRNHQDQVMVYCMETKFNVDVQHFLNMTTFQIDYNLCCFKVFDKFQFLDDKDLECIKLVPNIWVKLGSFTNSLVEISQNVTSPFTTTCDLQSFVSKFGNIASTRPNFNYFSHSHNYDATIKIFILLVGLILHSFSSINRLICHISHNSHQISCILKVFYNDIGV